jgi:hypothetical protein
MTMNLPTPDAASAPAVDPFMPAGKMAGESAGVAVDATLTQQARQAIEQRNFAHGIELLGRPGTSEGSAGPAAGPRAWGLLASAHFQLEQYDLAASAYERALGLAGAEPGFALDVGASARTDGKSIPKPEIATELQDWRAMRDLARANAIARVDLHVPDLSYFDRHALLAPPLVPPGALPPTPAPPPALGRMRRLFKALGEGLGAVSTVLTEVSMNVYGRFAGYRDAVWTNWYHRPQLLAILTLAYMRERLNAHNLGTSYPPGQLVGFQPSGQIPPPGVSHYRTADGSWNNLADPKEGAAGTRFLRNVALEAIRPENGHTLLTPNPRRISRELLSRPLGADGKPQMQEVAFLNLLAASWIQFMNHDWINHGEILFNDVIEVPLPDDDEARRRYWQTSMFVGRSQPDPTRCDGVETAAQSAINEVTHWWDGSQIYGSDQATQDALRSHVDGKLRLNPDGTLPLDRKGVEETGFKRNWWVGLSMLHTLFVREHNAICDELKAAHPAWDDVRLFHVARLINAAVMAKIHTVEWTPAILPNPALNTAMNANWYGLLTNFFRHGKDRRTVSEIKVRNPEMGGVVGNPIDKHGRGFGLTEEFVEVYRLHSLLPEELVLRRRGEADPAEVVPFHATRQSGSPRITQRHAMADLFYSFGVQHPGGLVLNNFPRFMQQLSIPGNPFFDMGTVDIVRARERGVPRYNEFRRQLGLNPIRRFEDLTDIEEDVKKLKAVYGANPADVEQLDLLIGTLAEGHRPEHFGFGETMFQIFILNATRRLQADRFYTDCFNEDYYTTEGMRWIDAADLKTVLLRHFPELASTGLANVRNAFEPWDEGPQLDPARHPLRASDPELRSDPWRGDAHRPFTTVP